MTLVTEPKVESIEEKSIKNDTSRWLRGFGLPQEPDGERAIVNLGVMCGIMDQRLSKYRMVFS